MVKEINNYICGLDLGTTNDVCLINPLSGKICATCKLYTHQTQLDFTIRKVCSINEKFMDPWNTCKSWRIDEKRCR